MSILSLEGGGWTLWEKVLLLVLLLSVSDDVNQVLVVQVARHIWGEGGEHLLHLTDKRETDFTVAAAEARQTAQCALKSVMMMIHNDIFVMRSVPSGLTHPPTHTHTQPPRHKKLLKCERTVMYLLR